MYKRQSTKSCQGHLVDNECVLADVDDLVEIGDIEIYIDESLVINTFLSHGYFKSPNCLREIQATVDKKKALMLTHEADPMKGGGPLEDIKEEIEDERLRNTIFSEERHITTWYRIAEFQLVSLKQISLFTLLQTPKYVGKEGLYLTVPVLTNKPECCLVESQRA